MSNCNDLRPQPDCVPLANALGVNVEDCAIARFQAGDRSAFAELFSTHSENVLRLALRILRDEPAAMDAAQEVFLRAYDVLHSWRWEARFGTWLYRTTLNVCREFKHTEQRHARKKTNPDPNKCIPVETPEQALARHEAGELIDKAISLLPPRQREVFLLRHFEQLGFGQIAVLLNLKEAGAKANYYKAVKNLRDYICYADPACAEAFSLLKVESE